MINPVKRIRWRMPRMDRSGRAGVEPAGFPVTDGNVWNRTREMFGQGNSGGLEQRVGEGPGRGVDRLAKPAIDAVVGGYRPPIEIGPAAHGRRAQAKDGGPLWRTAAAVSGQAPRPSREPLAELPLVHGGGALRVVQRPAVQLKPALSALLFMGGPWQGRGIGTDVRRGSAMHAGE